MNLKNYVKDHGIFLLIQLTAIAVLEGVLLLFHAAFALQMFFLFVELLALFGVLFYDYGRKRQFYAHMEGQMETLKEKYLLMEMLEEPEFLEGKIFCQVMQEMEKSMNDEIFGQIRRNNEFKRYVETWVHEVKLPIASIRLMLHEHRSEVSRALKEQVSRIESDVEQVLYYLRSEVPEKDYLIQKYSLKERTDRAIADNKDSLIFHHMRIRQDTEAVMVCTDGKWLNFMLGQTRGFSFGKEKEREESSETSAALRFDFYSGMGNSGPGLLQCDGKSGKSGNRSRCAVSDSAGLCGNLSGVLVGSRISGGNYGKTAGHLPEGAEFFYRGGNFQ